MPAKMTAEVWGQGLCNALVTGVVIVCPLWLLAYWFSLVTDTPFDTTVDYTTSAFIALCFVLGVGITVARHRSFGEVVLDCGPHPARLFLWTIALFLAYANFKAMSGETSTSMFSTSGPILRWTMVVLCVLLATSRLRIREGGIRGYVEMIPWKDIKSWSWSQDSTLFIRGKGWLSRIMRGAIPIPPEQQGEVEALLRRNCPAAATDPD